MDTCGNSSLELLKHGASISLHKCTTKKGHSCPFCYVNIAFSQLYCTD